MQFYRKLFLRAGCALGVLAAALIGSAAFASEILRIQPQKFDCGLVNEGDPAAMQAVVENLSDKEVQVRSVKTN